MLPTGIQDKVRFDLFSFTPIAKKADCARALQRSLSINGDIQMTAPRRNLAEAASRYSPVYSYRFDTVPENATILSGVSSLSLFPLPPVSVLIRIFRLCRSLTSPFVAKLLPVLANLF